jgi:uncharacterized protein YjiS (DUF1127 family)
MSLTEMSRIAAGVFERLMLWAERASQRRILSELDDNQLRDIGLTRHDAFKESVRPFWSGNERHAFRGGTISLLSHLPRKVDQCRFVALSENDSARRDWPSGRRNRPRLSAGTIIWNRR